MELQRAIGDLDARLAEEQADTYGGLWIAHTPSYEVVINMTSQLDAVAPYVQGTSLADITKVQKVIKSLASLEADQQQADNQLHKLGIAHESGINVYKNQAEVYVQNPPLVNSLISRLGEPLPEGVDISETASFSSNLVNAYAGNTMSACTAGYSVYDSFNRYGITTAGHCNNSQSYGSIGLRYITQWWSGARDVQWHAEQSAGNPLFKPWARDNEPTSGGTNYYREIYDSGNRPNQPIGALVCKYGYRTGYTCGTII